MHVGTGRTIKLQNVKPIFLGWYRLYSFERSVAMGKKDNEVIVGKITKSFCKKYRIKYKDFKIIQPLDLVYHTQKHLKEFRNIENYTNILKNVPKVINSPYFVYYDAIKNSIYFYKKMFQYVCVVVNILDSYAYVSTIYPVSKKNIDKLINYQNEKLIFL